MKVLSLRLPDELAARVEAARGDVPWQRWIVRAIERELGRVESERKALLAAEGILREPGRFSTGVVETAREALGGRSSADVKRDVRPVPKGGR